MRYVEFRDVIRDALRRNPAGLTWRGLKQLLDLPYDRPCPSWVKRLEVEVGLSRVKGTGRAYAWTVPLHKISADSLEIRAISGDAEVQECAKLMASSEPWITLRRTYEQATGVLTSPTREVYVGMLDGELVGFVVLVMRGIFIGFVQTLAVKPTIRNRGIGAALMKFAEQRILRDTPNVFLCVSSFNEGAQRFYERLGYEVVGELKELIVPGHAEVLMRKTTGPYSEFKHGSTSGAW